MHQKYHQVIIWHYIENIDNRSNNNRMEMIFLSVVRGSPSFFSAVPMSDTSDTTTEKSNSNGLLHGKSLGNNAQIITKANV